MIMKKTRNVLLRLLCCITAAAIVTGCIKEDMDDCPQSYSLTIRAYAEPGTELGQDAVSSVSIFIFDNDTRFVEQINTQIGESVIVKVLPREDLHIVAWGNLAGAGQTYSQPSVGDLLANCFVELQSTTRASAYALSPGDLFRGQIAIAGSDRGGDKVLPVYPEVGSMNITVRNLHEFAGFADNNYSIIIQETCSNIGFDGHAFGDKVGYIPAGAFAATGVNPEYKIPTFNMIPENTGVSIEIYHGTGLVAVISKDNAGQPLKVEKGKTTNVLINLSRSIDVNMSISEWSSNNAQKEF